MKILLAIIVLFLIVDTFVGLFIQEKDLERWLKDEKRKRDNLR